jgi:hypothetical protein
MANRRSVLSLSVALLVIVAFRLVSAHAASTALEQPSVASRVGPLLKAGGNLALPAARELFAHLAEISMTATV